MDKVVISKSSAVWRYYEYLGGAQAHLAGYGSWNGQNLNLCTFVRRIFFWTIYFAFRFVALAAIVLFFVGSAVFTVYWPIAHGWIWPAKGDASAVLLLFGCIFWGLVAISISIFLCTVFLADARYEYLGKKERKPSLLSVWLRAKKEKVCPLIEFKD